MVGTAFIFLSAAFSPRRTQQWGWGGSSSKKNQIKLKSGSGLLQKANLHCYPFCFCIFVGNFCKLSYFTNLGWFGLLLWPCFGYVLILWKPYWMKSSSTAAHELLIPTTLSFFSPFFFLSFSFFHQIINSVNVSKFY